MQSAVGAVESVRRTVSIAGFPFSAWAFALRTWAAMMVALYAAFWLQLESASSAAVTVGILALQTRGQAYQKAVYRILCTIIGVVASFAIAGLFAQSRELFVVAVAGWLGLCVYVGGFLDGNRAYGAALAGYTVALVAVTQIDSPGSIFDAGVNRGAAIVVGIAALALISDGFAAPNLHPGLSGKLAAAQWRVRAFARAILRGESADPIQPANLLCEITALHADITALVAEFERRIGARHGSPERRGGAGGRGQRRVRIGFAPRRGLLISWQDACRCARRRQPRLANAPAAARG